MTNDTDYLKREYERRPWAWVPELDTTNKTLSYGPIWHECDIAIAQRLKPRLPADLPEPPDGAHCYGPYRRGGIYVDGFSCEAERRFSGWMLISRGWQYDKSYRGGGSHYILDLSDPNADEIIALNRVEAKKPFDVEVETHPVADLIQSVLNDRIQYLLSIDEQSIRDALIALGWTPPGESEWLRLDECEFEVTDGENGWHEFKDLTPAVSWIKHGPAVVRVRRKGGRDE